MSDHRTVVEGIVYRYRCGLAWRDLPATFGPWQTVWKRHRRFSGDGTWDAILAALLAQADAAGLIDWNVSVDSTINRAHQHATNLAREPKTNEHRPDGAPTGADGAASAPAGEGVDPAALTVAGLLSGTTGGWVESQGIWDRARSGRH